MTSVEKEGMKLYSKLSDVGGDQASQLQDTMEDCWKHGPIVCNRAPCILKSLRLGAETILI